MSALVSVYVLKMAPLRISLHELPYLSPCCSYRTGPIGTLSSSSRRGRRTALAGLIICAPEDSYASPYFTSPLPLVPSVSLGIGRWFPSSEQAGCPLPTSLRNRRWHDTVQRPPRRTTGER
uniref:Uncharacterized protein n=1 Tax=Anopheles merus TaxID=30066 RepID=A0A182VMN5_ANOME